AKGSATSFTEAEYFNTMKNCLFMDQLLDRHIAIMDRYDPEKKVALAVDEWGIWTDAEPGTNTSFLYQQNSLRDALIAATQLNSFNNRADRIRMANLAQTVNVLQALILTDQEKMLLTPTYHVFDLYQVHQDAQLIPFSISTPDYVNGDKKLPAVNVSASLDQDGKVHITLVNIDPNKSIAIKSAVNGIDWKKVSGKVLTSGKVTDINKFDQPEMVKPAIFNGAKKTKDGLSVELPAKSVVMLKLE
ncbi:MAG: alpha-L-arabinofuranosidase C-terminal domain-containing protein, partial [Cyclobacteriaceae bacterium]